MTWLLPPPLILVFGAVVQASGDSTVDGGALQEALRVAVATRRGYCSWDVDHAGWVVTLHSPDEQDLSGRTPDEGTRVGLDVADGTAAGDGAVPGRRPRPRTSAGGRIQQRVMYAAPHLRSN